MSTLVHKDNSSPGFSPGFSPAQSGESDDSTMQVIWDYMAGRTGWSETQKNVRSGILLEGSNHTRLLIEGGRRFIFRDNLWQEVSRGKARVVTEQELRGNRQPLREKTPQNTVVEEPTGQAANPVRRRARLKWDGRLPAPIREEPSESEAAKAAWNMLIKKSCRAFPHRQQI